VESEDLKQQRLQIEKKEKELGKIRALDMQLALMAKETRKKKLDLMKTEDDVAEAVQSKRTTGPEKRKGSALSNRPGSTMVEDKGDTFLTDMLFKK
jgi:hypothetical protein